MHLTKPLLLGFASSTLAAPPTADWQRGQTALVEGSENRNEKFLIETAPGETRWVTEDEKWELLREDVNFFDITDYQDLSPPIRATGVDVARVRFPSAISRNKSVSGLLGKLQTDPMKENLVKLTSFYTRYYKSSTGAEASKWLMGRVSDVVKASGADKSREDGGAGATVKPFTHSWGQDSIIATIPGQTNVTVVIGAHLDSINQWLPSILPAPGADDNGSGSVTILEALRVLLMDEGIRSGKANNTVEFHWYSAEEAGLLGSQAVFQDYKKAGRDVRAMLQQDMTGSVEKTLEAGKPESLGVITDFVDDGLTQFIQKVAKQYCDIPYVLTQCGYACSDHASASKAGYPSAFVIEAEMKYTSDRIHGESDKIEYISFPHMLQHAKLTLGLAYELAYANLPKQ